VLLCAEAERSRWITAQSSVIGPMVRTGRWTRSECHRLLGETQISRARVVVGPRKFSRWLHSGECEVRGDDIGRIGVHIGPQVSALAGPNDVLPGEWCLFAVALA
jgi:hypothetical protein